MATICEEGATCPHCGNHEAYSEERFNSHQFFACPGCGFQRESVYLGTDEARIEQHRAEGWEISPSFGGTTFWASREKRPQVEVS
jgi:hypothetical protein